MSSPTGAAGADAELSREELWGLYKIAVDEYRFMVTLNWQRSQYYLGLNAAIITIGAGLVRIGNQPIGDDGAPLTVAVFIVGFVLALFSMFAIWRMHGYYGTARDRMVGLGSLLNLGELSVASTPGAQGDRRRLRLRVKTVHYAVLGILAAIDVFGAAYVATR